MIVTAQVIATKSSTGRAARRPGRPASAQRSSGERSRGSNWGQTGRDYLACRLCKDTAAVAAEDNMVRATSEAEAEAAVSACSRRDCSRI
ncbi:unnamed protein product [Musa hybrid cultivar]